MKVMNTSPKVIGFGKKHLVQNEIGDLPNDFGPDHPTVKYFLRRGWITKMDGASASVALPADYDLDDNNTPPLTDDDTAGSNDDDAGDGENQSPPQLTARDVQRMSLEGLRTEATRLEIDFSGSDTKAILIAKILEKLEGAKPNPDDSEGDKSNDNNNKGDDEAKKEDPDKNEGE